MTQESLEDCWPTWIAKVKDIKIKQLWRDVWTAVTSTYYDVPYSLEEEGLLDISNTLHIFLVHYVFLPRLRSDLHTFTEGWNHHPLCTEGNMTPLQLWRVSLLPNSTDEAENVEDGQDLDRDSALYCDEFLPEFGVVVPTSLYEQDMTDLQAAVDPTDPSDSHGPDIYCRCLQIFQ